MIEPLLEGDGITLYHGDCLEVREWLSGDVLVTDPPYGIAWRQDKHSPHAGIINDHDTAVRDAALKLWGDRPALVFGDIRKPPPQAKQALAYVKAPSAGLLGALGGWRRNWEPIYMTGKWPQYDAKTSGVITTTATTVNKIGGGKGSHPHRKPTDVMEQLIMGCPPGVVVDPFAGSGSTLIAARNQGRQAIGVEIDADYCDLIIRRLAQRTLL